MMNTAERIADLIAHGLGDNEIETYLVAEGVDRSDLVGVIRNLMAEKTGVRRPVVVFGRKGTASEKVAGVLTGNSRRCNLEGCNGLRLSVRWPDGHHTFPCTKGMEIRDDGQWQIL